MTEEIRDIFQLFEKFSWKDNLEINRMLAKIKKLHAEADILVTNAQKQVEQMIFRLKLLCD